MSNKENLNMSKNTSKTAVENASKSTEQENKTAPNGMPVYDINEPWVQQYIEDFGSEPSFF